MGDISLDLDLSDLEAIAEDLGQLEKTINNKVNELAAATHAHITELAQERLHSRRELFMKNLQFKQVNESTFVITILSDAAWIDDGLEPFDMRDTLLKKNAKVSAKGDKYKVIPFEHSKGPTQQTPAAQSLTSTIKQELKRRQIPYAKIERDDKGRPKTGLLHKFDIMDKPLKQGPGKSQGQGPEGKVMQGSSGNPLLQGIRIYQKGLFDNQGNPVLDKKGQQKATRSIMTFRTISEANKQGWKHPGLEGMHFLEEGLKFAQDMWEKEILPDLLKNL